MEHDADECREIKSGEHGLYATLLPPSAQPDCDICRRSLRMDIKWISAIVYVRRSPCKRQVMPRSNIPVFQISYNPVFKWKNRNNNA